jgi:hypothetical protein
MRLPCLKTKKMFWKHSWAKQIIIEVKVYIEANPAEHRVNLTNYKGEAQQLEHYKKPEFKNDNKKDQKQEQTTEDTPAKKQRKGAKMKI